MLKKVLSTLLIIGLAVLLAGCNPDFLPRRDEISDLTMVRILGVDKGLEDPDHICVTLVSKKTEGGDMQSGSSKQQSGKNLILSHEAPTVFEAVQKFQTLTDKLMHWGQIDYYLIGEEAAREGVHKYIDYLARDHEIRNTSEIYIIKGSTAKEFIEKGGAGDYYLPDRLKAIGENVNLVTGPQALGLYEFMQWINQQHSCAVAPVLSIKPKKHEVPTGNEESTQSEPPPMEIAIDGYAIFKDLQLVDFLDREMTVGENYLLNRVLSGYMTAKAPDGTAIALEIIDSACKIDTVFEKDELKGMKVTVKMSSNLVEVQSKSDIFTRDFSTVLSDQQSYLVKSEIEKVISFAQQNNTDFIDMANVFAVNHPVKWLRYKDKWDEIFPTLPISVEVTSKVNRTYDIRQPNGVLEEEHK